MRDKLFIALLSMFFLGPPLARGAADGTYADMPILMHRSLFTQGAFPLPWKKSSLMYEPNDRRVQWAFGWGGNLETEVEWCDYYREHIYSYSVRWKVPRGHPLQNGLFGNAYYSSYTNDRHLNVELGYLHNISDQLSFIPQLKLPGSSNIAPGISATWTPFRHLSGNLGAEYVFDNKSGTDINAGMTLTVRFWKGFFVEEKISLEYQSRDGFDEYLQLPVNYWRMTLRQEQYLGMVF